MQAKAIVMMILLCAVGLAQPDFKDYVYDSAQEDFPKITLPIARVDFLGVFDYMYQPTNVNCPDFGKTFDRNTCLRPTRANHPEAVDFGVSPFDFKYDFLINPFPYGAKVKVTDIIDASTSISTPPTIGWAITITCFLDGDYTNTASTNKYSIQFGHLKAGSFRVFEGQEDLEPGAILAQIGLSGLTTADRPHTHAIFALKGRLTDPFKEANDFNPTTDESLWFDQAWVDRISNYRNSRTTMSFDNLKINDGLYVNFPNHAINYYDFTSQNGTEAAHLWMVASPDDDEIPIGQIDLLAQPGINPEPVPFSTGTIRFEFLNQAANPGEFAFVAEYVDGDFSTKVWVEISDPADLLGLYRPSASQFFLDNDGDGAISTAAGDQTFAMGAAGDRSLAGDWNGDGVDELGLFRPTTNQFFLDVNGDQAINVAGGDWAIVMGAPNDLPLVGDWNRDGVDELGLFRPSTNTFYLDIDGNGQINLASGDREFAMGAAGDLPIVGDWDGDRVDETGLYRPSTQTFFLDVDGDGAISLPSGDRSFAMGAAGDLPIVGDWNDDAVDEVGLFRPATNRFYLDANGNGAYSPTRSDKSYVMGAAGDLPIIGNWQ